MIGPWGPSLPQNKLFSATRTSLLIIEDSFNCISFSFAFSGFNTVLASDDTRLSNSPAPTLNSPKPNTLPPVSDGHPPCSQPCSHPCSASTRTSSECVRTSSNRCSSSYLHSCSAGTQTPSKRPPERSHQPTGFLSKHVLYPISLQHPQKERKGHATLMMMNSRQT
jgi:hypothetical protein